MLSKLGQFVKKYQPDIILFIGVVLIALLAFAAGYITAKSQETKPPLQFEYNQYDDHSLSFGYYS